MKIVKFILVYTFFLYLCKRYSYFYKLKISYIYWIENARNRRINKCKCISKNY